MSKATPVIRRECMEPYWLPEMPKEYYADARRLSLPVAAQKSLLPVGDDPLGPDVPDLLDQLSAMPCRVIDISNRSVPAFWRASWNVGTSPSS